MSDLYLDGTEFICTNWGNALLTIVGTENNAYLVHVVYSPFLMSILGSKYVQARVSYEEIDNMILSGELLKVDNV